MKKLNSTFIALVLVILLSVIMFFVIKHFTGATEVTAAQVKQIVTTNPAVTTDTAESSDSELDKEAAKFSEDEIKSKEQEIYDKDKDDILSSVSIDDDAVEKTISQLPDLQDIRLAVTDSGKTFYILKDDPNNYKIGGELNGEKITDIKDATEDEVKSIVKNELTIRKANEELYRRAITELEKK
jgi:hypothetical protein